MEQTLTQPVDHLVEIEGSVATVTLNRPALYNAVHFAMLQSLHATFAALESDERVRAIVFTGAGKAFCAGQGLDGNSGIDTPQGVRRAVIEGFNPLILKLLTLEKPIVAAVNGVAAGAGMGLALACDFRFVATSASFTTAFAKIGLVPDSGVSYLLPRLVGYARTIELTMLSEKIDAQRADALGLVTKLVDDDVRAAAHAFAKTLAAGPRSLGYIKRELVHNGLGDVRAALMLEADIQTEAAATEDFAEGIEAFRTKRSPLFRGR
jgi:2-(1,2-epoxy-1,2-dihydrophenyl)acetyl-CoA isomerase